MKQYQSEMLSQPFKTYVTTVIKITIYSLHEGMHNGTDGKKLLTTKASIECDCDKLKKVTLLLNV